MSKPIRFIMLREDGKLFLGGRPHSEESAEKVKQYCREGSLHFGKEENSVKVVAVYEYDPSETMMGCLISPVAEIQTKE